MEHRPQRSPRCFALLWVAVFLGSFGVFPAFAQTRLSPGVDGLCDSMGILAGLPDGRRQEGMHYPAWNLARFNPADNRQVAALRVELDSSGFLHRHLYVLNLATRRQKLLVRDVGCGLSWSRTGWLVLERNDQLWKMKANGDSLTSLTARSTPSVLPEWSPSGRLLACLQASSDGSNYGTLVLLTPKGRVAKRLPSSGISILGAPAWSPDGRKLAYRGIDDYREFMYEFDLKTGKTRVLFEFSVRQRYGYALHWRKNGKEIIWRATDRGLTAIDLASRAERTVWNNGLLLSLDLDATGRRGLMVTAEGRAFNPSNPREGGYLQSYLFTANLNGTRRIGVK